MVTGKLYKKTSEGTEANPIWIVTPMDRRRRDEEIPEKELGKVITAAEAMNNRAPKLGTKEEQAQRAISPMPPTLTPSTSNSSQDSQEEEDDDEEEEEPTASTNKKRRSGRLTPSDDSNENFKATSMTGKSKSDGYDNNNSGSEDSPAAKKQKSVKFTKESNDSSTDKKKKNDGNKNNDKATSTARVGTRTTRGSGEALVGLLPDVMPRKKGVPKKKLKKDENVVVVKMLTGTLYLYRGEKPRAEFVRHK